MEQQLCGSDVPRGRGLLDSGAEQGLTGSFGWLAGLGAGGERPVRTRGSDARTGPSCPPPPPPRSGEGFRRFSPLSISDVRSPYVVS